MNTLHETTLFNVEASLNDWLRREIGQIALPAWMPAVNVVTDWKELEASLPAISLAHLPGHRGGRYERGAESARVMRARGMADISCWVSRSQAHNGQDVWQARLRYMQGMVDRVYAGAVAVVVKDYLTSLAAQAETEYRIVLGDLSVVQVGENPNPDIERRRMLLNYQWFLRG